MKLQLFLSLFCLPALYMPASVFRNWQVSAPFDEARLPAGALTSRDTASLSWQTLGVDERGVEDNFLSRDYRFLGTIGYYDALYLDLAKGRSELWMALSEDMGGWGVQAKLEDMP